MIKMASNDSLIRTLLIVGAAVLLVPFLMMLASWPMMGMWGGGQMWADGAGTGWPWLLSWVIFLLVILGVGYLLYRALLRSDEERPDAALEELRLAFARGDLSSEEFEERQARLTHSK